MPSTRVHAPGGGSLGPVLPSRVTRDIFQGPRVICWKIHTLPTVDRFLPLLVDVWRQSSKEPRIDLSAGAIAAVVVQRMPCARLLVRGLDPERRCLETVAEFPASPSAVVADPILGSLGSDPQDMEPFSRWCLSESVLRGDAADVHGRLAGLVPDHWEGSVLARGLTWEDQPLGALALGSGAEGTYESPPKSPQDLQTLRWHW